MKYVINDKIMFEKNYFWLEKFLVTLILFIFFIYFSYPYFNGLKCKIKEKNGNL